MKTSKKTAPPNNLHRVLSVAPSNRGGSNANLTSAASNNGLADPGILPPPTVTVNTKAINESKATIQALEKAYRESQQIRRLQNNPITVFNEYGIDNLNSTGNPTSIGGHGRPSMSGPGGGGIMINISDMLGFSGSGDELLTKVTKELAGVRALKERNEQEKAREKIEREEVLRDAVKNTREFYKAKQECMQAGPKFLYNFFSTHGNIQSIEPLDKEGTIFAVFTETGAIEIIEYKPPELAETSKKQATEEFDIPDVKDVKAETPPGLGPLPTDTANKLPLLPESRPESRETEPKPVSSEPTVIEGSPIQTPKPTSPPESPEKPTPIKANVREPQKTRPSYQNGTIKLLDIIHLDLIPPSKDASRKSTVLVPNSSAAHKAVAMASLKNSVMKRNSINGTLHGANGLITGVVKVFEALKKVIPQPATPSPAQSLESDHSHLLKSSVAHGSRMGISGDGIAPGPPHDFGRTKSTNGSIANVKGSTTRLRESSAKFRGSATKLRGSASKLHKSDSIKGLNMPPVPPARPRSGKANHVRTQSVLRVPPQAPSSFTTHGFYVGTSFGEAIVLEIEVSDLKTVTHTITKRKRTSIQPLKTMCVAEFHEAVVSVVSHTATDRLIIAHTLDLIPIWECKLEFCIGAARDHTTRKIQQGEFSVFTLSGTEGVTGAEIYFDKTGKGIVPNSTTSTAHSIIESTHHSSDLAMQLDETVVSHLCPDKINKRILVSLKSGTVVSISAPFAVNDVTNRKAGPPTQPTPPQTGRKPSHVPISQQQQSGSSSLSQTPSSPGNDIVVGIHPATPFITPPQTAPGPNVEIIKAPSISDFTRTGSSTQLASAGTLGNPMANAGKKSRASSTIGSGGDLSKLGIGKKSSLQLGGGGKLSVKRAPSPLSRSSSNAQVMGEGDLLMDSNISLMSSRDDSVMIPDILVASKELFVSWLVDTYSIETLLKLSIEAEQGPPTDSNKIELDSSQAALFQITRTNSEHHGVTFVPISTISLFFNDNLGKDQLLVTCPDGSIRIHNLTEGGTIPSMLPNFVQVSDPESRTQLSTVTPSRTHNFEITGAFCKHRPEVQLILAFSSEGNLSVFDIDDNTVLLDMLVLTNRRIEKPNVAASHPINIAAVAMAARARAASVMPGTSATAAAAAIANGMPLDKRAQEKKTETRNVKVVNPENGRFLVWAGREWSLMTNASLIRWKLKNITGAQFYV
ncbi:hypothetical protein BDR26DRAFT_872520 [Obelidium mucronatum]|nr:hypothetical protein BDR26DRAFT_872520 [Obelidium mucronatum]